MGRRANPPAGARHASDLQMPSVSELPTVGRPPPALLIQFSNGKFLSQPVYFSLLQSDQFRAIGVGMDAVALLLQQVSSAPSLCGDPLIFPLLPSSSLMGPWGESDRGQASNEATLGNTKVIRLDALKIYLCGSPGGPGDATSGLGL